MHHAYKMLMCLVVSILLRCVQEEHWGGDGAQEGFYWMCIALNKNWLDFFLSPLHLLNFCNVGNFLVKLDQLLGRVCISNFKFWPFEGCKEQWQSWHCLLAVCCNSYDHNHLCHLVHCSATTLSTSWKIQNSKAWKRSNNRHVHIHTINHSYMFV